MVRYGSVLLLLSLLTLVYTIWRQRDEQIGGEPMLSVVVVVLCIIGALAGTVMVIFGMLNMHIE